MILLNLFHHYYLTVGAIVVVVVSCRGNPPLAVVVAWWFVIAELHIIIEKVRAHISCQLISPYMGSGKKQLKK